MYIYIYVCLRIYSEYILRLSVSKYILLYNHYNNSEHSDRNASVVYQVIGHAKCDRVGACQIVCGLLRFRRSPGTHAEEKDPFCS